MDKIKAHPWFNRLTPKPSAPLVPPPTPEQLQNPVSDPHDVDEDIMQNLRTLWQGTSRREIFEALTSDG